MTLEKRPPEDSPIEPGQNKHQKGAPADDERCKSPESTPEDDLAAEDVKYDIDPFRKSPASETDPICRAMQELFPGYGHSGCFNKGAARNKIQRYIELSRGTNLRAEMTGKVFDKLLEVVGPDGENFLYADIVAAQGREGLQELVDGLIKYLILPRKSLYPSVVVCSSHAFDTIRRHGGNTPYPPPKELRDNGIPITSGKYQRVIQMEECLERDGNRCAVSRFWNSEYAKEYDVEGRTAKTGCIHIIPHGLAPPEQDHLAYLSPDLDLYRSEVCTGSYHHLRSAARTRGSSLTVNISSRRLQRHGRIYTATSRPSKKKAISTSENTAPLTRLRTASLLTRRYTVSWGTSQCPSITRGFVSLFLHPHLSQDAHQSLMHLKNGLLGDEDIYEPDAGFYYYNVAKFEGFPRGYERSFEGRGDHWPAKREEKRKRRRPRRPWYMIIAADSDGDSESESSPSPERPVDYSVYYADLVLKSGTHPAPPQVLVNFHIAIARILDETGLGEVLDTLCRQVTELSVMAEDGNTDIFTLISWGLEKEGDPKRKWKMGVRSS